jgi:hypothetical protein
MFILLHPHSPQNLFRYILSWYQKAQLFFSFLPLYSLLLLLDSSNPNPSTRSSSQECLLCALNSVALSIRFVFLSHDVSLPNELFVWIVAMGTHTHTMFSVHPCVVTLALHNIATHGGFGNLSNC